MTRKIDMPYATCIVVDFKQNDWLKNLIKLFQEFPLDASQFLAVSERYGKNVFLIWCCAKPTFKKFRRKGP